MADARPAVALALLLLPGLGCHKKDAAKLDAGVSAERLADPLLGFSLMLPPTWLLSQAGPSASGAPDAGAGGARRLGQAYRRPPANRGFMVAPRLVASDEPCPFLDAEQFARSIVADLRALQDQGQMRIERSQISSRYQGANKISELEVAYALRGKDGKDGASLVHRSLVTLRGSSGAMRALTLTATYLADDAELVSAEVQGMFQALELSEPKSPPAPPAIDGGMVPKIVPRDPGANSERGTGKTR